MVYSSYFVSLPLASSYGVFFHKLRRSHPKTAKDTGLRPTNMISDNTCRPFNNHL